MPSISVCHLSRSQSARLIPALEDEQEEPLFPSPAHLLPSLFTPGRPFPTQLFTFSTTLNVPVSVSTSRPRFPSPPWFSNGPTTFNHSSPRSQPNIYLISLATRFLLFGFLLPVSSLPFCPHFSLQLLHAICVSLRLEHHHQKLSSCGLG